MADGLALVGHAVIPSRLTVCGSPSYSGRIPHVVQESLRLTPVYEPVEGGCTQARLVEVPGVTTAAPTQEQAQEQLVDALHELLLSFGPVGPLPAVGSGVETAVRVTITVPVLQQQ